MEKTGQKRSHGHHRHFEERSGKALSNPEPHHDRRPSRHQSFD